MGDTKSILRRRTRRLAKKILTRKITIQIFHPLKNLNGITKKLIEYGASKANGKKIDRWSHHKGVEPKIGPKKTTNRQKKYCHQTSRKKSPWNHYSVERNKAFPKVDGTFDSEIALPTIGERDRSKFQDGTTFSGKSPRRTARGRGGLFDGPFRRHQLVGHPRQTSNHHAKGYPIGKTNPRRKILRSI